MKKTHYHQHDILIIGSGLAGLTAALQLADNHQVALLSKDDIISGASQYAQGGIAAAKSSDLHCHIADTLASGANTNNRNIVKTILKQGTWAIDWLQRQGVVFSSDGDQPCLHQEAGHSERRIYHIADHTGKAIINALAAKVQQHPNIRFFSHHIAIDLVTKGQKCMGAYCYNESMDRVDVFQATHTILATGGASKVYLYTSNPNTASGDGIAMALRAGVHIKALEFNQFHPTCLYHPHAGSFLITEALRGEGGKLRLPNGNRFMQHHHPDAELATRDTVARAIDHEMKRHGIPCVFLDMTHRDADWLRETFPTVYQTCQKFNIDIANEPIPVVPAAHYTCGGIETNEYGLTNLDNLYAIGEVAHTGLHGANRLASNSLLECVVMGNQVSQWIKQQPKLPALVETIQPWDASQVKPSDQGVVVQHCWDACRRLMWDYVGIVRSNQRLDHAHKIILLLEQEIDDYYRKFLVNRALIECRNIIVVAKHIIAAAKAQSQNTGLHYNLDLVANHPS